ncbi:hypothetical protein C8F04DRAFT_1091124 [Mycena alexandri]|uniref:Zn(2)-C6 fungal-type domain-containing protein n=1 Tax=Mycena alexandri TaxID=1745969 RepID=A0AAD6T1E2_9AGAR|nr:hypothetical protein C8F04DRAFT_1091124 [Mycena alexandri]
MMSQAKVKLPVCKACRSRKVRCDGEKPCASCSRARKPTVCEYPLPPPSGSIRPEIAKGSACIECRQKKRKCDGNRPCSTCLITLRPEACQYREHNTRRKPRNEEPVDVDRTTEAAGCSRTVSAEPPDPPLTQLTMTLTVAPSLPKLTIPTPAQLESKREIDLSSLRNLFLENCWDYGLEFSPTKRAAIVRGDTSSADIHPIFIPVSQLMGFLVASELESEEKGIPQDVTQDEIEQRLRVLHLLDSTAEALDPLTYVQVYKLLAQYYAQRDDYQGFAVYLASAADVALDHEAVLGLDDSRVLNGSSHLSRERAEEARSALAHMVYLAMASSIVVKSKVQLHPMIITKFRRIAGHEIEASFVRAKCVLLLAESQELVEEWNRREPGTVFGLEWSTRCRELANDIQDHLHRAIVSLSALAELHAPFAPFHAVPRQKHRNIINAVASITRTFAPADLSFFDCILEVSWDITSREISQQPPTVQWTTYFKNIVVPAHGPPQLPWRITNSPSIEVEEEDAVWSY